MESQKLKTGYISVSQKKSLIELLKGKEQLISGRFSSTFSKKQAQQEWEAIGDVMNAIPGAKKHWTQWRRVSIFYNFLFVAHTITYPTNNIELFTQLQYTHIY